MKKPTPSKLAEAVGAIDADSLRSSAKTEFIQLRASKEEKKSVQDTAHQLKLSVSEYLLKIHALVKQRLSKE